MLSLHIPESEIQQRLKIMHNISLMVLTKLLQPMPEPDLVNLACPLLRRS